MDLKLNITQIKKIIAEAEMASNRKPGSVLLLAVSKQQNVDAIAKAFELGIINFGENYFQEAQHKIHRLRDLPICWHFIGPIQSNKTKGITCYFDWVHSINRLKVATLLNEYRPENLPPLNVCIQINLVDEQTKSGTLPEHAAELAMNISQLPRLKLRGLMTIPPPQTDEKEQYQIFLRLNQLLCTLNQKLGLKMDTLSMGMSDDIVPAIQAGSTIVRVGRAIFGERK